MVNSGRLSVATVHESPLSTPDEMPFGGSAKLGAPAPDAPMLWRNGTLGFLVESLSHGFELLYVKDGTKPVHLPGIKLTTIGDDLIDQTGRFAERFDATPGACYLLRPDQHLCARFRAYDADKIAAARDRALGRR
jgi:3-(3-hydroxy-phenyl)propionate hydroxylase